MFVLIKKTKEELFLAAETRWHKIPKRDKIRNEENKKAIGAGITRRGGENWTEKKTGVN